MKNFRGLTDSQSKVFEFIAIGRDGGHNKQTLETLKRKGLIEKYPQKIYGVGRSAIDRIPVTVNRYSVPIDIHIEWCEWCEESEGV